jgi:dGTPase
MRQDWEQVEQQILADWAAKAANSKGRACFEEECALRTVYQRDRDRIIHSKAFRRLKNKTQVFVNPASDHFRTRLTHTLEVAQISRVIARALRLNEDLTEAIALGHDLGHTPFGHAGERALATILGHFEHNEQSLRVVDIIERDGHGLNLTVEVRDGILHHSGQGLPTTLEGQVVKLADRVAYLNHDVDDAISAKIITVTELPPAAVALGNSFGERIDSLVSDIVQTSCNQPLIKLSEQQLERMDALREFLFAKVYFRDEALAEEKKLHTKINHLYNYYLANPDEMTAEYRRDPVELAVADYIAGMTDPHALLTYDKIIGGSDANKTK